MEQTISPPREEDITRLAKQALHVSFLAREHLGRDLPGNEGDLEVIQEILDLEVLGPDATYSLQSLGVVMGMRLVAAVEGLDWAMVEDEYGRDPALRYQDTSLLLFPLTMISKRIEDAVEVDVRDMFDQLQSRVTELKDQVSRSH